MKILQPIVAIALSGVVLVGCNSNSGASVDHNKKTSQSTNENGDISSNHYLMGLV